MEEEKPESIKLKKILVEKHMNIKERVSPKDIVLDTQTVKPLEFKISLETADGILKPEEDEQEKEVLKYFILAPDEEEPEMTSVVSRKPPIKGEKIDVAIDHILYEKDEPLLVHDEELKLNSMISEHMEKDSAEEKGDEITLVVCREGALEEVSDNFSVLHEGEIPVHEKEEETESICVPKHIPREPYELRDQKRLLGKERRSKIHLQNEEYSKNKKSFEKDITGAEIAETPLLKSEKQTGGFTLEKSEVLFEESANEHGTGNKTQWMKKSGTTVAEISIDNTLIKEAKKMEVIQDYDKDENMDLISAVLHPTDLSEETEPPLTKDVDLVSPAEDEIPREKPYVTIKPSVLKSEVVEEKKAREKYPAKEGELHYKDSSEHVSTEKALINDKKTGKKIIPTKEEKTTFSTHLKNDNIQQSHTLEKLPVRKEIDTVITAEGKEGNFFTAEQENRVKDEKAERYESIKIPFQPPERQDKKQCQEVRTIQDEHKEFPAFKSSKDKTEEKKLPMTVEEMKLSGKEQPVTESTSDEKSSAKRGTGKSTPITIEKANGKLSDKAPLSKGITGNEEVTYSSSIGKIITPKKSEGDKEQRKSEFAHMAEQVSRFSDENRNLDAPGEPREVRDVPAKPHAKRGEEDCRQILLRSACTICFRTTPFAIVMFGLVL